MSAPLVTSEVEVLVVLGNGTRHHFAWTTPVNFGRLLGKGGAWARQELRETKTPGRSDIQEIRVTVRRTTVPWERTT